MVCVQLTAFCSRHLQRIASRFLSVRTCVSFVPFGDRMRYTRGFNPLCGLLDGVSYPCGVLFPLRFALGIHQLGILYLCPVERRYRAGSLAFSSRSVCLWNRDCYRARTLRFEPRQTVAHFVRAGQDSLIPRSHRSRGRGTSRSTANCESSEKRIHSPRFERGTSRSTVDCSARLS